MKRNFAALAIFLFLMAVANVSHATLFITLSDGTNTYSTSSSTGQVSYSGVLGNFFVNSFGYSAPMIGNADNALMDIFSFDMTSLAGGTLTITLTDDNFSLPNLVPNVDNAIATMDIGGTQTLNLGGVNSVSYSAFLDGTLIGTLGAYTSPSFSGSLSDVVTVGNPFTLTQIITITSGAGTITSLDASLNVAPVPEPGTLLLLGGGLVGVFSCCRRRMRG